MAKGTASLNQGTCVHPVLEDLAPVRLLFPSHGCGRAHALAGAHVTPQRVIIVLSVEAEIKL